MKTITYGDHKCTIADIRINGGGIYTLCATKNHTDKDPDLIVHSVRFANPDSKPTAVVSQRIGIGELRDAFPKELGTKNEMEVVAELLENTSAFIGKPITVGVEKQLVKGTTQQAYSQTTKEPLYNVRLRSALTNVEKGKGMDIAKRLMFTGAPKAAVSKDLLEKLSK
jgi:hypothetical protein